MDVERLQEASAREESSHALFGQSLGDCDGLFVDVVLGDRVTVGREENAYEKYREEVSGQGEMEWIPTAGRFSRNAMSSVLMIEPYA